jgi:hypothetical protein
MLKARTCVVLVVVLAVLVLSACAAGPNEMVDTGPDPAGFWLGLWQGLISPITFLISVHIRRQHLRDPKQRKLVRLRLHAGGGHGIRR